MGVEARRPPWIIDDETEEALEAEGNVHHGKDKDGDIVELRSRDRS